MINLAAVDLNLLVAFHVLLLERNVTRAADKLGVTQPTMSGALGRLRAMFGDELFVRTPSGMRPTARARDLAEPISQAVRQLQAIVDRSRPFDPLTTKRTFTIGATYYANFTLLPPLVSMLRREGPEIDTFIRSVAFRESTRLLDEGAMDLAVGVLSDLPKRLRVRPLFTDRLVCIACRGHAALGNGLSLKKFLQLSHVRVALPGDPTESIDAFLLRKGRKRRSAVVLENFYALAVAVSNSDLIAAVPERLASALALQHRLAIYELPFSVPAYKLAIAWSKHGDSDPGVRWLRDRTCKVLQDEMLALSQGMKRHTDETPNSGFHVPRNEQRPAPRQGGP